MFSGLSQTVSGLYSGHLKPFWGSPDHFRLGLSQIISELFGAALKFENISYGFGALCLGAFLGLSRFGPFRVGRAGTCAQHQNVYKKTIGT